MLVHNGDNPWNNAVKMDFINRKVDFTPIRGEVHIFWVFASCISATIFLLFLGLLLFYGIFVGQISSTLLGVYGIVYLATTLFSIGLYFIPSWKKNHYPKFNAFINKIFKEKKEYKWQSINKEALINNQFYIYNMRNIVFEYEATQEFAEHLASIEIINAWEKDLGDWICRITWKKTPDKGYMKIRYI